MEITVWKLVRFVMPGISDRMQFWERLITLTSAHDNDHKTGRLCEADGCSGELEGSVVPYGESLPAKVQFEAHIHQSWQTVLENRILRSSSGNSSSFFWMYCNMRKQLYCYVVFQL